jgi:heme/copper-type cytochrome/quinol oxidase subunit 2
MPKKRSAVRRRILSLVVVVPFLYAIFVWEVLIWSVAFHDSMGNPRTPHYEQLIPFSLLPLPIPAVILYWGWKRPKA